ncbi:S9 family peptidase [Methanoculleus chikugoensis]|uniref:alpha/beta hydrolase family protein n=1 Tax=Methanoculleus chikugoensis TaxID=118126 RepID=UPI001FB27817|nr:prolyl oligopeptidase family serine peptidase [Methanoculleus chikugoensis]
MPEWEFNGTPRSNPDGYNRHNPVDHIENWTTPMLVIQGGRQDYQVPDTQSLAAFTALQKKGIPGQLLYIPR